MIDAKTWDSLREWLAKLHPAVRLKYLHLAIQQADIDLRPDIETMTRQAEDELINSPEWRRFGTPVPEGINIAELFPALAGSAEEEKTLERRISILAPEEVKAEAKERGIELYKPAREKFEIEYRVLSTKEYRGAREGIKELYERVTGLYDWSKTHGVAPEEVRRIQEEARQVLPDAIRVAGGASTSSEIYRRMLVRTEQMMRTMRGMAETTKYEMETYKRAEEEEKYAS